MEDLYSFLKDTTENMVFTTTEDDATTDMSFDDILAVAEEKCKELFVDDETPGY